MSKFLRINILICFIMVASLRLNNMQPGFASNAKQDIALVSNETPENGSLDVQSIYLPVVYLRDYIGTTLSTRRINAPFFDVASVTDERLSQMAIAWLGKISSTMNYADIRVGYNNEALYIGLTVYDRLLWYDTTPAKEDFQNWDSATLLIKLNGNSGMIPDSQAYRFDAQLNWWEDRGPYQSAYRGNGNGWESINTTFETKSVWRGEIPNDNQDDRGWIAIFVIPFTDALGLSGRPTYGTTWGMGMTLHDRDDAEGTPIGIQSWPENISDANPSTWGQLHFGLPEFTTPPITPTGSTTIRHKLNGTVVQDAAVGGTTGNLCPGDSYFIWNEWGEMNFAGAPDFNIQNQADVADWPCFSKYYITFPLDSIPVGKVIISAKLTIFQFGNAGDLNDPDPSNRPHPSLIQILRVFEEWSEMTISWNNAPLAYENISQIWVEPLVEFPSWPGVAREWDVSYGVEQSYLAGKPLNIVLYEADGAQHSGKYFSSSDAGDWNEAGRPTLVVSWGDP